jgi:hypothetical protein
MPECTSCGDDAAVVEWRDDRWCVDCFEADAGERGASADWVRRVIGRTVNPTFEPPVQALALGLDSRVDLLSEQTVLDEELAEVQALRERGLSDAELAAHLGVDPEEIEAAGDRIENSVERARNTVEFLD